MAWIQLSVLAAVVGFFGGVPSNYVTGQNNLAQSDTQPPLIATHYRGNWTTADCNYQSYHSSTTIPGAAVSKRFWYNSGSCGGCLQVKDKSSGRSVTVMVVDTCAECTSDIALFNDGWKHLAPLDREKLNVEFEGVSCRHSGPLQIQFSKDIDPTYLSVQVLNSNYPVFDIWVRPAGQGEGRQLRPREWNFFEGPENEDLGEKLDFKVDCSHAGGGVVYLENVLVQAGLRVNATANC